MEALCYVSRLLYTFLQHFSNEQIGCPWVPWDRFWNEGWSWETMKKYGFCYASRIYDLKNEMKVTHHSFVHRKKGCQTKQVHAIRLKLHRADGLGVWFVVRDFICLEENGLPFLCKFLSLPFALSQWIICTRIDWLCRRGNCQPPRVQTVRHFQFSTLGWKSDLWFALDSSLSLPRIRHAQSTASSACIFCSFSGKVEVLTNCNKAMDRKQSPLVGFAKGSGRCSLVCSSWSWQASVRGKCWLFQKNLRTRTIHE